ncbi:MAG: YihY/virulence factor BrkB family protein [Anaerolineae bacterium]
MKDKGLVFLVKRTFKKWGEDKAARLAAAMAYYTVFSLAPLLVIIIGVAGLVFGEAAAQGQIVGPISDVVGPDAANLIQDMIASTGESGGGVIATVIGTATLLLGASGVFGQLQGALNTVWDAPDTPKRGILGTVLNYLLRIVMVLFIGLLLIALLAAGAAISAVQRFASDLLPLSPLIWQLVSLLVTFGLLTLVFALIFKFVPNVTLRWSDVWVGALVTAFLFAIGQLALSIYLGRTGATSAFGAAGALVVLLLWIYYSSQILFLGAEFTQVYARHVGSASGVSERSKTIGVAASRAQQALARSEERRMPDRQGAQVDAKGTRTMHGTTMQRRPILQLLGGLAVYALLRRRASSNDVEQGV